MERKADDARGSRGRPPGSSRVLAGEQITLFHPESGNLRNWLRGITAFYGRIGELSQEDVANLNAFGFLNDSFLKGLQQ